MRCLGRTKSLKRCKNKSKGLFCRHHRWQPITFIISILTFIALFGGLYQDVFRPISKTITDGAKLIPDLKFIEHQFNDSIDRTFDENSLVIAGARDLEIGRQIDSKTKDITRGKSLGFFLYCQPTEKIKKEPIVVDEIRLIIDSSEIDIAYTFPIGPQEMEYVYEFEVELNGLDKNYLLSNDIFRLDEGDFDAFRVKMSSSENRKYIFHIEARWWLPSNPSNKKYFKSRQYRIAFPKIMSYRKLLENRKAYDFHINISKLGEVVSTIDLTKSKDIRMIIPGFNYLRPDKTWAATNLSIISSNPFHYWREDNLNKVRPGDATLRYKQGLFGEPYFQYPYIIIDKQKVLYQNRGRLATLIEDKKRVEVFLRHFNTAWETPILYENLETIIPSIRQAIDSKEIDKDLSFWLRYLPSPPSIESLVYGYNSNDEEVKEVSLESLEIIGLGNEQGALRNMVVKKINEIYKDENTDDRVKFSISELSMRYDFELN
jgi:hypothetical protein